MQCPVCDRSLAETGGVFVHGAVVAPYCIPCSQSITHYSRAMTRFRHTIAAERILTEPEKYPHKIFDSEQAAVMAWGCVKCVDTATRDAFFEAG